MKPGRERKVRKSDGRLEEDVNGIKWWMVWGMDGLFLISFSAGRI